MWKISQRSGILSQSKVVREALSIQRDWGGRERRAIKGGDVASADGDGGDGDIV